MKSLIECTDSELEAEVARRAQVKTLARPLPLVLPDWDTVERLVKNYAAFVDSDDLYTEDSKFVGYIVEAAVEAVFGSEFWTWKRRRRP